MVSSSRGTEAFPLRAFLELLLFRLSPLSPLSPPSSSSQLTGGAHRGQALFHNWPCTQTSPPLDENNPIAILSRGTLRHVESESLAQGPRAREGAVLGFKLGQPGFEVCARPAGATLALNETGSLGAGSGSPSSPPVTASDGNLDAQRNGGSTPSRPNALGSPALGGTQCRARGPGLLFCLWMGRPAPRGPGLVGTRRKRLTRVPEPAPGFHMHRPGSPCGGGPVIIPV